MNRLNLLLAILLLPACKDADKSAPTTTSSAAAPANPAAPAEKAVASATTATGLAADESGALAMSWKVANAPSENVTVSLVVGGETFDLGKLSAASDDAPGTIATCGMKNKGASSSELWCGGTPAYNFLTATLKDGNLVVTRSTGVDGDPGSDKKTELLKKPTAAKTIKATGPATPALYGNCRAGYVQKTETGPCMRQCLKGNECKPTEKCEMTSVKGLDGDHKVHACVTK